MRHTTLAALSLLLVGLTLPLSAPIPVSAQPHPGVPCDLADFDGTVYDVRTELPGPFVDAVLSAGAQVGPERTLVVIDVDNTLLGMHTDLGADQWYRWQKALTTTCGAQPMEVATAVPDATDEPGKCGGDRFDAMLDIQYLLFAALPMHALEGMAETVQELQDLDFPVIALTARNPIAMDTTRRELMRNGIDMTVTGPAGVVDLPPAAAAGHGERSEGR